MMPRDIEQVYSSQATDISHDQLERVTKLIEPQRVCWVAGRFTSG
jgi:hypothetical protein